MVFLEQFRNNREYVWATVKSGKIKYHIIPVEFRTDKELVREILYLDGECFCHVNTEFKNDRDILWAAAIGWSYNLKECPDDMKDDKELVLEIIQHEKIRVDALKYCSDRLRDDKDVILEAIKCLRRGFTYVPPFFFNIFESLFYLTEHRVNLLNKFYVILRIVLFFI